jgi:Domain of unknown function (DUF5668)
MTEPRNVTPGDDWRRRESPRRRVDTGTVVWGLILIVVGGWFFLDQTLGFEMPDVDWGTIWPVILIVIGAAVILQGLGRRRT